MTKQRFWSILFWFVVMIFFFVGAVYLFYMKAPEGGILSLGITIYMAHLLSCHNKNFILGDLPK